MKSNDEIAVMDAPARPVKAGRGRPVGDRAGQRAKLLNAVMTVIAKEGYIGASLRKVAKQAGFTTGAVSYYFDNKEAMMAAAAEHLFDEFDAMLRPLRRTPSMREGFERWLSRMSTDTELWLANSQLLAYASQEPRCAEVFSRRYSRYRENYAAIIMAWQTAGNVRADIPAEILADQLCAMADGWAMTLPIEPQRYTAERSKALIDGLIVLAAPPLAKGAKPN